MSDYYEILDLSSDVEAEEIADRIKEKKRIWVHRQNAPKPEQRREAEENLRIIPAIEETLLNAEKRMAYDQLLRDRPRVSRPPLPERTGSSAQGTIGEGGASKVPKWLLWIVILCIGFPVLLTFILGGLAQLLTGPDSVYRKATAMEIDGGRIFTAEAGKTYYFVMRNQYAPTYIHADVPVQIRPIDRNSQPTDLTIRIEPGEIFDARRRWGMSGLKFIEFTIAPEVSGSHEIVVRNRRAFQ